jgi:2-dehydropantoate 2-reductase
MPFKPSMLVDLEAGRPMEVEGIVGAVVKQAKEVGIPVPRYVITMFLVSKLIIMNPG